MAQAVHEVAYRLWEEQGRPAGRELEHWLDAERLVEQDAAPRAKPRARKAAAPRAAAPAAPKKRAKSA